MRRALFGKSPEIELPTAARVSAREALLFDIRDHEASNDFTLAERRINGWTFAPWLLLASHIVVTATLIFQDRSAASWGAVASAMTPLGLSLLLDLAAGLVMIGWRRMQMAPHSVTRLMCGYIALTGLLWMISSAGVHNLNLRDPGFATVAMVSGFFLRSIAAVASPPLAVVNAIMAI